MDQSRRPRPKYVPRHCPFLNREVWAIVTKQAGGTWRIVNCLDKHQPCTVYHCAFAVDSGTWPFADVTVDESQFKKQP